MRLNPNLVRGYVLLAIDVCRLTCWVLVVVNLITNYVLGWRRQHAELQQSLQIAKRQVGLHSA